MPDPHPSPPRGRTESTPDAPLLRLRDVGITHDGATDPSPASVSFEVGRGEVVLLLGPSGSGKSTLALSLDGLIPHVVPAELTGTVEVAGIATTEATVATLSTHVAMVFQDPDAQLVTGTILDEVAFGPENLRLPADEVLRRAEESLRRVGLWHRRAENPDVLSGGGRQRLAIAAALAMGSPLLVLDEPTANLDPQGIEEVYATLAELVAEGDRSIVLIEHNLDAVVGIVDRVVVLDQAGRTVANGPVDDVLRRRAAELHRLGVWLPTSALAALRLRTAGYVCDPLPLTPEELRAVLAQHPPLAASALGATALAAPLAAPLAETRMISPDEGDSGRIPLLSADGPLLSGPAQGATVSGPAQGATVSAPQQGTTPADSDRTRPTDAVVQVRGLSLTRGRRRERVEVLHDVSLDVVRGEFVAIVGANGAGKTTLLQAIAGVIPPPRGSVRVDGIDVSRTDPRTLPSRIGFVFQNPEHQFIAHTVADEIAHGLRRLRLSEDEVHARTSALLERFGLEGKADAHPFLLSGGQKRRLSVGTALVAGAPVLALDEPTFGQDRARADELLGLLAELNRGGTTIIVVTHDMQLVSEYADRMILVEDGRIAAHGPTGAVFDDVALIERAGLRVPPLRRAVRGLSQHPQIARATRLADLPGDFT
ncbi:ABC transporter ATP-binding protein [Microbacterium sp. cx-59]|uniref:ABC transporter ATP-binding protein n=1 Tax=Microbacterium sp. cx-59 TaxID=2891207 RepID=UPI001E2CA3BF|nr:ABC transporter ATP-binding protein [Microbacterium sp. cx-59]MCC4908496.1 energy-coupling factor ABC transporter ATP-binding protein [Microbacterium sp. cx-59]